MTYKINYKQGTYFAVPLRGGGYGIGVVARAKKACILGYFFGPRREFIPKLDEVLMLEPNSAVSVLRVGDLGLVKGEWPIIGEAKSWKQENWPMPVFIRREPITLRNWLVYYSNTDPSKVISEVRETHDRPDLLPDSLSGYGAAEIKLTKLLVQNRGS
jgi:hypothetical protein